MKTDYFSCQLAVNKVECDLLIILERNNVIVTKESLKDNVFELYQSHYSFSQFSIIFDIALKQSIKKGVITNNKNNISINDKEKYLNTNNTSKNILTKIFKSLSQRTH